MKRYFVRYLESRKDLVLIHSPSLVLRTSFNEGVYLSRHSGHARKKDAIEHIARVNAAAGKEIAVYHGAENV